MPNIRIELLDGRSIEQKRELAENVTREVARVCRCRPEDVQIVFADVRRADWSIGGRLLSDPDVGAA